MIALLITFCSTSAATPPRPLKKTPQRIQHLLSVASMYSYTRFTGVFKRTFCCRPPTPPFTKESATLKVRMAENVWNSRNPDKVSGSYTIDCTWRNRDTFIKGREEIISFLSAKWAKEKDYRLIKELWATSEDRIAVRFAYEWKNESNKWYRSYGNENWEFNADGLMKTRIASINDIPITEKERKFHWEQGKNRPNGSQSLSEFGL